MPQPQISTQSATALPNPQPGQITQAAQAAIAHRRLQNQQLVRPNPTQTFTTAQSLVRWMGAVQAQEYERSKWGIALRTAGLSSLDLDRALAEGHLIRTHVMRPTWHFVSPDDLRWMLMLTGPRVNALSAYYYRKFGLDDALFARSHNALTKALSGGKQLTRTELLGALQQAGIDTQGVLRLGYLLMRAELDAVICSGGLRGKQFTYALVDERVPNIKPLSYDAARAELVRRYFTSHGPATAQDFVWWSGLTMADTKAGLADNARSLIEEHIGGITYWRADLPFEPPKPEDGPIAHLLPTYDEFLLSYKDRRVSIDPRPETASAQNNPVFDASIVINGKRVGLWQRTFKGKTVIIKKRPIVTWSPAETQAIDEAAQRYADFAGLSLVLR